MDSRCALLLGGVASHPTEAESSGQLLCAQAWKPGSQHAGQMSLSKLREIVMDRESGVLQYMDSQRVRHD